jgi:adenosylmethionine---8-amino-7-oxononanoate aminotransferase
LSLRIHDADREFVWHPYTQMRDWNSSDNKVIVRGKGFYLIDTEGNKYLDGNASMWCNVWGHSTNKVIDTMVRQLRTIPHSTLFGLSSAPSAKFAEKFVKVAKGMQKIFYSDNGSTAVEVAMKMALHYWINKGNREKKRFISLEHGYHGDTAGAMSLGYIAKYFRAYKPLLTRVHKAPSPYADDTSSKTEKDIVEDCIEQTERILKKYSSECSAFVMESGAQIAGGVIIYPSDYQMKISELCKKYDVLLILDEIATGFGRLGNMVEYLAQGSRPDIVCFGKALTAGYFPLAITATTNKIFNAFLGCYSENKQFYHGHTFTGNAIGCAAALANLELYKKTNLIPKIKRNSEYLAKRLNKFKELSIVKNIRHKGLLAGLDLSWKGKPIKMKHKGIINYYIMQESLKEGVFIRPLGNTMLIIPPLAINRYELEKLLDVQFSILKKIQVKIRSGF